MTTSIRTPSTAKAATLAVFAAAGSASACKDRPERDDNGCWVDAHEAYTEIAALACQSRCTDAPGAHDDDYDECMIEQALFELSAHHEYCFDGCTVDACIQQMTAYNLSCTEDGLMDVWWQCWRGPDAVFWDPYHEEREWREDCAGWEIDA